jgi:hypothetical protein
MLPLGEISVDGKCQREHSAMSGLPADSILLLLNGWYAAANRPVALVVLTSLVAG